MKKRQIRERNYDVGVIPSRESDQRGYALHAETKSLFRCARRSSRVSSYEGERKDEREKSDYPAGRV